MESLIQLQEKREKEITLSANTGVIAKDDIEGYDPTKEYYYAKAGLTISFPLFSTSDQKKIIEKKIQYLEKKEKLTNEAYEKLTQLQNYDIEISSRKTEIEFLLDKIQWTKKRVDGGIEETEFLWRLVERHIFSTQALETVKNKRNFLIQEIAQMGGEKWEEILSLLGEKKKSKKS